jgi:hypothetical protein
MSGSWNVKGLALSALCATVLTAGAAAPSQAACPAIPTAAQTSDPYAGLAPIAAPRITVATRTDVPNGGASYCLYHPALGRPVLGMLLFAHGAQLTEQGLHDPVAEWLAELGFYVVYPYISDATRYPSQARAALSHALTSLAVQGVRIDRLAVAGFSLGGLAAVRVAATWTLHPPIRAIVLHDPAGLSYLPLLNLAREYNLSKSGLAAIRCDTRLLIVQSQTSTGSSNSGALTIWNNLPQVARYSGATGRAPNRNFLRVPHDASHRDRPPHVTLPSLHEASTALPLTSMDLYGYWLPLYRAVYEAFFGVPEGGTSALCNGPDATGSCARTRDMGTWLIDGVPATPMRNAADLQLLQGFPSHCPS